MTGKYDTQAPVIINPGSGPVQGDPTLVQAVANIVVFISDVSAHTGLTWIVLPDEEPHDEGDGRWTFRITDGTEEHEIEMPGIPLAEVRYMQEPTQNIWDFPRLYVDGSSWVWCYAIRSVKNDEDD